MTGSSALDASPFTTKLAPHGVEIEMIPSSPPTESMGDDGMPGPKYTGLKGHWTETLPEGYRQTPESKPLSAPIFCEYNVSVPLRDGMIIYADVRRPADCESSVPAIICWCPYGKEHRGFHQFFPLRVGIPASQTSQLEHAESPDPGYFCPRGYAMVHFDPRGSWDSGGDLWQHGSPEGLDIYDAVEFVAKQPWCSGSVGMAGNSWLAIAQWFAAAQEPPSLKCIAPWEGLTDTYRDLVNRGGICEPNFNKMVMDSVPGRGLKEDYVGMGQRHPLANTPYWADKIPNFHRIKIPAYVVGSYSSSFHVAGTMRGFRNLQGPQKWLRIHPHQEWHDIARPENQRDLCRFYDRYLKGIDNGWEETPAVRISLLRYNKPPIINRVYPSYPPPAEHRPLYLAPGGKLQLDRPEQEHMLEYNAEDYTSCITFDWTFQERTILVGYPKLKVFVSAPSHDDADVYTMLRKLDSTGAELTSINFPLPYGTQPAEAPDSNIVKHLGMQGKLRMSHRRLDPGRSTDSEPFHPHDRIEKVAAGTRVEMNIGVWPMGVLFEKGEGLRVVVAGFEQVLSEIAGFPRHRHSNKGSHQIFFGGSYASHILLPFSTEAKKDLEE